VPKTVEFDTIMFRYDPKIEFIACCILVAAVGAYRWVHYQPNYIVDAICAGVIIGAAYFHYMWKRKQ